MASLTAAEYQALNARKGTATPRKTPAPPKEPSPPRSSLKTKEPPEDTTPPPTVAETHYIGRYQLNVANGTHYPGRARYVVTGPTSEALTAALVAALHHFTSTP